MARVRILGTWLGVALIALVGYWYVTIYVFDDFNAGYGRDNWFALTLYIAALSLAAGLVGCGVVSIARLPRSIAAAAAAGVVFVLGVRLTAFILSRAFPDADMTFQGFVGAFAIGALSMLVVPSVAVRNREPA